MIVKLETKSNRVKGISFHPTRPWVLASLHNGVVQLWDFRTKTLIDKFDEHDGPVRGVCFHSTQPLFVSGGDDYKIKVWNYKQRKCLFTLTGHADYIRTVEFHREYPWILSASDDLTIRIWNWQSRSCIAILTGHNHYVMSASFHPKEDLIVSASLDQTVRVWDITGLRKKNVYSPSANSAFSEDRLPQNELFANPDAVVKFVLEGHDRGVNWASFHPTAAMIVSGADDRTVKIWRYNETKAWDSETFRGHTNNVSCATFHPKMEVILSNSEDKTIRAWDMQKKSGVQVMRREQDRFWVVAAHPELNLFAAGHDGGMIVFKIDKERPPYCLHETECVFYVKEKYLRICEFSGSRDIPILTLKGKNSSATPTMSIFGGSSRIKSVNYSAQDKAVLVCYDQEGGPFELYLTKSGQATDVSDSKKGTGATAATFVGGKRIAVLEVSPKTSTYNIVVRNMALEETKRCTLQPGQGWNGASVDNMWGTPIPGVVLLKGDDRVVLYDVQQRRTASELVLQPIFDVKHVSWSPDHNFLALAGSDTILLVSKKLEPLGSLQELSSKIKSIAWDENGVLLYSTHSHIKYCLPVNANAPGSAAPLERGIVRTLDSVLYITAARGNKIFCLDREVKMRVIMVDNTEYLFKNALNKRQYNLVLKMVKEYNLMGDSIIAYLQNKGFPEVALYFVKDVATKFGLAIECGNIEIALECAHKLDSQEYWNALGAEALKQGNHQILEMAYQRTKEYDRLSFLYLITGNLDKLKKMQKIAEMRGDDSSRFHNALYLGDIHEQIKVLEKTGQLNLAYITAKTHGLSEEANVLAMRICNVENPEEIQQEKLPKVVVQNPTLMMPPTPILRQHDSNWPLLNVSKGYFDGVAMSASSSASTYSAPTNASKLSEEEQAELMNNPDSQWEDVVIPGEEGEATSKKPSTSGTIEGESEEKGPEDTKGEWELDLDPEVEQALAKTEKASKTSQKALVAVLPSVGPALSDIWVDGSNFAVDHFAAGAFDSAFAILRDSVGIVNFAPLKPLAMSVFTACKGSLPVNSSTSPVFVSLSRNVTTATSLRDLLPALPSTFTLSHLIDGSLKEAFKLTTAGKFGDALTAFQNILHSILFLVCEPKDRSEVKNLLTVCRDYILGLRLELHRKELAAANGDIVRQAELAAYFTHCNLEQIHLLLSLRSAMNCFFKIKNYKSATSFAKRLLDLDPKEDVAQQAMKVLKFCEQNQEDAYQIKYNERNPFVVCGISMVPIYKGTATVQCGFCMTHFLPEHAKKLCPSCGLAEIGRSGSGLQIFGAEQKKGAQSKKSKQPQEEDEGWD